MKSIVCFGAGVDGCNFISVVRNKVKIEYFLDNVQSGQIENYQIYKPSKECCAGKGKYIVVTTTRYYESIKKQLESYGLRESIDFVSDVEFLMAHHELLDGDYERDNLKLHLFLRKRKAIHYTLWQARQFNEKSGLTFEIYQKAVILPLKKYPEDPLHTAAFGRGGVVDQSGKYVRLSGIKGMNDGQYSYENPQYRDERVVYCGYFIRYWGHLFIESVARLWYFLKHDHLSYKYVFIVTSGTDVVLDGNYREFFRLLGILDRIEMINKPVQYREVIVPELSYDRGNFYSADYKNTIATVIDNAMKECKDYQCYDKVYLARNHWSKIEFGLDMVEDFFQRNGFKVISPETLTLTQMIYILQNADMVAATSGTVSHNILFGKDGQELIIIERSPMNNAYQVDINRIKQLNVTHIDANLAFFPVSHGSGPFLFHCNRFLFSFAEEREWNLPDQRFMSDDWLKNNLRMYKDYHDKYCKGDDPRKINDEIFEEAYMDSMREVLNGNSEWITQLSGNNV